MHLTKEERDRLPESPKPESPMFELKDDGYNTFIWWPGYHIVFARIAETGFGLPATHRRLAEKIVEFLNSLPPESVVPYPYRVGGGEPSTAE
jgi:hypothetical protein